MAEMFGTRPSRLLDIDDPRLAFQVDEALFVKLRLAQQEERERDPSGAPRGIQKFPPPDAVFDMPVWPS